MALKNLVISLSLLAAGISFGLGVTLPLVNFEKFFFFSESPSLIEMLVALWRDGQIWISLLVAVFSIALPLLKMAIVFHYAVAGMGAALPRWLSYLSKWSMMDVVLVALVIFGAKTSGVATAIAQPGMWFYASAAVLSVVAAELLKQARQGAKPENISQESNFPEASE